MLRGSSTSTRRGAALFGASLHTGFEWVLDESPGSIVNVTTESGLLAALDNSGDIIDLGGNTISLSGQVILPDNADLTTIQNGVLSGGRVYKSTDAKWRLRSLEVALGSPDNVKPDGGFIDIDGCNIHGAPDQGVLVHASNVVIRNSRIHNNGNTTSQDHGIYLAQGTGALIYNCLFYNNQAYAVQLYPQYHNILMVCCTMYGGVTRGGVVIGSENVSPTSNVRLIGCISVGSASFGYEQYQDADNISLEYCLGYDNASGNFDTGSTWTVTGSNEEDPLFTDAASADFTIPTNSPAQGLIPSSLYEYVPAEDIDGSVRTEANVAAGAYIAA